MFGKIIIETEFPLEAYWVIGDVHGCMFTLEELIKQLPKDAIPIFVGDLVDRGKYSKNVVEFVLENKYLAVEGNHEFLMYNYIRDTVFRNKESIWVQEPYGGLVTVKSYGNDCDAIMRHIKFIEEIPKYRDRKSLHHAWFRITILSKKRKQKIYKKLYTQRIEELYDKEEPWQTYNIINVFGHTSYPNILFGQNYIGVDTGCVMTPLILHTYATNRYTSEGVL